MTTKIYSVYKVPKDEGITFSLPSLTQQHFKNDVDINQIIARYNRTGLLPQVEGAMCGDFDLDLDYQTALNRVIAAQNAFEQLPAQLRKRFNNNPAELLSFVSDPNNRAEGEAIGLFKKSPPSVETPDGNPAPATGGGESPTPSSDKNPAQTST